MKRKDKIDSKIKSLFSEIRKKLFDRVFRITFDTFTILFII